MQHTDTVKHRSRATQRANILEGARHVFARKGKAATMADIAEAAGVSQGLAYRYFASKEEIYRELVDQAIQAGAVPSQQMQEQAATPGERLTLLITKMVEYRRDHPDVYQLLDQVLNSDRVPDDFTEAMRQRRERFLSELRQLIIEGQATEEVAAGDPDQLVTAIAASLEGLSRFALHEPEHFRGVCPGANILLRMLRP